MSPERITRGFNEDVISRRKNFAQQPLIDLVFPFEVYDPNHNIERATELVKQGNGILVVISPHPAEIDSIHVARALLETELGDGEIVAPIAVHQLESGIIGRVVRYLGRRLSADLKPVVTQRTRDKFPEKYSHDQEEIFLDDYIQTLLGCLKNHGTGVIFDQGDRAGSVDIPPARGIISVIYIKARRSRIPDLVNNIAILPGYLHNPKVIGNEIRALDPFVRYTIAWGDPFKLSDALKLSESVNDAPGRIPKLDWFVHQRIANAGKNAKLLQQFSQR